jgi:hypothetical protein
VLTWPLTAAFGPLVAYNVMTLLAPAIAAAAGHVPCLEVGGRRLPAIAGVVDLHPPGTQIERARDRGWLLGT